MLTLTICFPWNMKYVSALLDICLRKFLRNVSDAFIHSMLVSGWEEVLE